jgi:hypothetical protein
MYYPVKVGKLSDNQIKNLISGRGVRVKQGAENILHLSEQQIKKLERAAKKGGGMTLQFDPYQAAQHRQMRGGAIGAKKVGRKIVSGLKVAGRHAIEQGIPAAFTLASMAGDPTGMSGNALGNIAAEYASDAYQKDVMNKGKGLFKKLHKAGINVKRGQVIKGLKETASGVAAVASQMAGQAVATYTGNPELGQKFSEISNSAAQTAINSGNLKKGLQDAKRMTKNEAVRFAVEAVDDQIDKRLSGNEKRLAENLLANKYGSARDLVYDMSEMYTGTGMKLKRKFGRPRKTQGGALYPAGHKP